MSEKTVCQSNMCVGCNACVAVCKTNSIKIVDNGLALNAVINTDTCNNCKVCEKVCQQNLTPVCNYPLEWYQGWAKDDNIRVNASSGGFASCAVYYALENDYQVYACTFSKGTFVYRKVASKSDFKNFTGSKYVKSNTSNVFGDIKTGLASGNKVLFVGLPCHVQGLKLFVGQKNAENLMTIDLICHGTPSFALYKQYLKEKDIKIEDISNISFRQKNLYCSTPLKKSPSYGYWLSPFLSALTYTENCFYCKYAKAERVSDITIGDSWGSFADIKEKNKGISLILCNTEKGKEFSKHLDFHYETVDSNEAVKNNVQLSHPSRKPPQRVLFESAWKSSRNYHKAIKKCYKKDIIRRAIFSSSLWKLVRRVMKKDTASHNTVQIQFVESYSKHEDK